MSGNLDMSPADTTLQAAPTTAVAAMNRIVQRPLLFCAAALVLVVLLATVATVEARVPFDLEVANNTAILHIDGQELRTSWPKGITHVGPMDQDPITRLFQVDGSDISGTGTYNPDTFRAFTSTSYYRFLCWVRDCGSYSQWSDFTLRDDTNGRLIIAHGSIDTLARTALPPRFTLRGALQRPEVNANLLFTGSSSIQLAVGPDPRTVFIGDTSRYYPHDVVPYLAEVGWTLTRSYLWSVALLIFVVVVGLLVTLALAPFIPAEGAKRAARLESVAMSLWPGGAMVGAGIILAVLLGISSLEYQQLPRVYDAIAYYFQAKIMSTGNLWVPAPPDALHLYFLGPFMVSSPSGHWFAHYPPGAPLAIAIGMVVHAPWIVEPVLGSASVVLMAFLGYRWYGKPVALLTVLLTGLSPFFLFLAPSFLSHTVVLFALLVFLVCLDLLCTTGDWRWAAVASAGVGYAFLSRELDTVAFSFPVVLYYGWRALPAARRALANHAWRPILTLAAALAVPVALCLLFYLFYDWRTTGNAFFTPRAELDPKDSWGFGPGKGWYGYHSPAAGFFIIENQLTILLIHLFGWPYYLTLSFFFLPLATLRLKAQDCLLYVVAACILLAYGGLYYHGIAFGPRYLFASLPAYILLTGRGLQVAALSAQHVLRLVAPAHARIAGCVSVSVALAALIACNVTYYLPHQFALYYDYLEQRVDGGLAYSRLHPAWMHNAIILTGDGDIYGDLLFPLNDPYLKGDILYARAVDTRNLHNLIAAYPHRTLYWLAIFNRTLRYQRMSGLTSPVQTIDLNVNSKTQLGGPGFSDLAIDGHGDTFVANANDGSILRFNAAGKQIGTIVTGLAAGSLFRVKMHNDAICWPDTAAAAIRCADESGGHRYSLLQGKCGDCGDFVFAPNGDIIVAATSSSSLRRYSRGGMLIARSSPQASLRQPTSVAVTEDGHVFAYDVELHHTVAFDYNLRSAKILTFGSEGEGGYTHYSAVGDWLVGTDPATQSLIAYNARTKVEHAVAFTSAGDLLPVGGYGLAWNGHQLVLGQGLPGSLDVLHTGVVPF